MARCDFVCREEDTSCDQARLGTRSKARPARRRRGSRHDAFQHRVKAKGHAHADLILEEGALDPVVGSVATPSSILDEIHNLNESRHGTEVVESSPKLESTGGRDTFVLFSTSIDTDAGTSALTLSDWRHGNGATDLSLDALASLTGVRSQELEPVSNSISTGEPVHSELACAFCDVAEESPYLPADSPSSANCTTLPVDGVIGDKRVSHRGSSASASEDEPLTAGGQFRCDEVGPTVMTREEARTTPWARFLQHFFRRSTQVKPGCWSKGGLASLHVLRPVRAPGCAHGQNLATPQQWDKQRERAMKCMRWYKQYLIVLKKSRSGMAPLVLDLCCKSGGASEGIRRVGAETVGVDIEPQPYFKARFGGESFILHDAFDMDKLRELVRRLKPLMVWASPNCQGYSTAPHVGSASKVERLIPLLRSMLVSLGVPFVIENVTGAKADMIQPLSVWGQLFGRHQDRERLLESGGGLVLRHEATLEGPGQLLREQSCLGRRRRFPRRDPFGRLIHPKGQRVCCEGNIFATQGASSHYGSLADHAESMGIDQGHMDYKGLSQAILPDYASYVVGQAAMHVLKTQFGFPVINFDEMVADERTARAAMAHWLEGAGAASPRSGLAFVSSGPGLGEALLQSASQETDVAVWPTRAEKAGEESGRWSLTETDFRELDYTHAGCYDTAVLHGDAPNWTARLHPCRRVDLQSSIGLGKLRAGENTLIHLPGDGEAAAIRQLCEAAMGLSGRVTIITDERWSHKLEQHGFRRVLSWSAGTQVLGGERHESPLPRGAAAFSIGHRECFDGGLFLDHDVVRPFMDPRDRGCPSGSSAAKAALAWSPLQLHPELWKGKGLPRDVELIMTNGVQIDALGDDELCSHENSQYRFKDGEHLIRGVQECDRALLAGHLELVPDSEVEWALSHGSVHPWTVVHQSADKWRSCQDYKQGTNSRVVTTPFTLCSALEVERVTREDSHFAKFDLRDGFWSVPVARSSRHHLMVRHPATGALLRCTSLPFGYTRSPEHFCRVTEAVAQLFRRRVAGRGIHVFVFVDDFLLVGDTRALTVEAMHIFMDLLIELGLPYAPHKTRGPTRVIEFLGFLLSNIDGQRCSSLTESRQKKLEKLISDWLAYEPAPGRPPEDADPKELASFLGNLVFASEVIPGGRVYMQAMLLQFKGLEIDWARGLVRSLHSPWRRVTLLEGFWRDVHWWRSALRRRNCLPFSKPQLGELAVVGTDASDFACGELVWLDGTREEVTLVFTHAERRRPINFRELRGTLRALEVWGPRLRGRTILIETDNGFGHAVLSKMKSKSEDAQELVRRIHHLSLVYDLTLRSVHTPGKMLIRPDQTSRGASPSEPRLRLTRDGFAPLEQRFGPFDEYLGAERELRSQSDLSQRRFKRLWAHPDYDTVGSTLRLICQRLSEDTGSCARGVVVVPLAPEAGWWKLTRHFACVGRWESGKLALEANVLGSWQQAKNQRPTLLLSFPRAGAMLAPLSSLMMLGTPTARAELGLSHAWLGDSAMRRLSNAWVNPDSPMPTGTLLYSPRRLTPIELDGHGKRGASGVLYITREPFDGSDRPVCAELRRRTNGHRHYFWFERGSLGKDGEPWAPDCCSLWVVNHLGGQMHVQPSGGRESATRYLFDFDRAEDEITWMREALRKSEDKLEDGSLSLPSLDPELVRKHALMGETQPDLPLLLSGSYHGELEGEHVVDSSDEEGEDDEADAEAVIAMSNLAARSPAATRGSMRRVSSPADSLSRREDAKRALARKSDPPPAAGITSAARCHYGAMPCRGCRQELGIGTWMIPGGAGMVHNLYDCYQKASVSRAAAEAEMFRAERVRAELRPDSGDLQPIREDEEGVDLSQSRPMTEHDIELIVKPPKPDRNQKGTQLIESLSDQRREMVRECMEGRCPHVGSGEPLMTCTGSCHRTIHGVKCAQITHGHAVIGCFECPDCQLRKVFNRDGPYPEEAVRDAEETMLLVMSRGAEKSGAGYADFVQLQSDWALETGKGEIIALPVDSNAALKLFLTWVVRQRHRERSLPSIWRVMGSYMIRTGRVNLTHSAAGDAKAHYASLLDEHGVEEEPRTAITPRMLFHLFHGGVIAKHCPQAIIRTRTEVDYCLEGGCGMRVGEALTGGDYHGLKAGHLIILQRLSDGLVTIEGMIEHSKTKFKRFANCLGTTLGKAALPFESSLRAYWKESGMKTVSWKEGGYLLTTVDYQVLRVSFLGMKQDKFDLLLKLCETSAVGEVRRAAASLAERARKRYEAKHSKDKRYINIIGGERECDAIAKVSLELTRAGFGEQGEGKPGFLSVVAGPLLRATDGHRLSHMPVDPSTTYTSLHKMFDDAYLLANQHGDPDPWLDLQGLDEPLWGHHSLRRGADTVARASMEKTGVKEDDIDLTFGWQEKMYSQKMQYHYATRFNREKRYRVTMYL